MIYEIWVTTDSLWRPVYILDEGEEIATGEQEEYVFKENIYQDPNDPQYVVIKPKLTMELNKAGSFEFTIPPSNIAYDKIKLMLTTIDIVERGTIIWTGRPTEVREDIYNRRTYTCEGALAFFNDVVMRVKTYKKTYAGPFFNDLITRYNGYVTGTDARRFTVGIVNVDPNNNVKLWRKTDFETAWECLETMLLNAEGGYFKLMKSQVGIHPITIDYISALDNTGRVSSRDVQTIQFGKNLTELTRGQNAVDVVSDLVPVCHYNDKVYTLKGFENDNGLYHDYVEMGEMESDDGVYPDRNGNIVNWAIRKQYGQIYKVVEFDMVTNLVDVKDLNKEELLQGEAENKSIIQATKEYMFHETMRQARELQFAEMVLDVTAADLVHKPADVEMGDPIAPNFDTFKLGQIIRVVSTPNGVNKLLPVSKISMDLDTAIKKITLGIEKKRELTEIYKPKKKS